MYITESIFNQEGRIPKPRLLSGWQLNSKFGQRDIGDGGNEEANDDLASESLLTPTQLAHRDAIESLLIPHEIEIPQAMDSKDVSAVDGIAQAQVTNIIAWLNRK